MGPTSIDDIAPLPEPERPADPLGDERDQTFQDLSQLTFDLSTVDESKLSEAGRADLAIEREQAAKVQADERIEAVTPMMAEVARDESLPLKVRSEIMNSIHASAVEGAHPENIVLEELTAVELEEYNSDAELRTHLAVADTLLDERQLADSLAGAAEAIRASTEPTIPYLERGVEMLTSGILFLKSGGLNINGMVEHALGIVDPGFDISGKDSIKAASEAVSKMTPEQHEQVIDRMKDYAIGNSGILLNNSSDAEYMIDAIHAIFGGRMKAHIKANNNALEQLFGVVTSASALNAAKIVGRVGAKAATKRSIAKSIDEELPTPARSEELLPVAKPLKGPKGEPITGVPSSSPAAVIAERAPSFSKDILRTLVTNPTAARKFGTSPEAIAEDFILFKSGAQNSKRGPALVDHGFNVGTKVATREVSGDGIFHDFKGTTPDTIAEIASNRDIASDVEINRGAEQLARKFDDSESVAIKDYRLNLDDATGISADYILTKKSGIGFESVEEAEDFVAANIPKEDFNDFVVLQLKSSTGEYTTDGTAPEFAVQVNYLRNRSDLAISEDVFNRKSRLLELRPRLTNALDTTVGYIERQARAVTRASNTIGLIRRDLTNTISPMKDLNLRDLHGMWRVLKKEEAQGAEYARDELKTLLNPNQRRGYYAVRNFYNKVHGVRNDVYRDVLKRGGYQSMRLKDGSDVIVREARDVDSIKTAWYEKENRIVDIEYLRDKGIEVDYVESHLLRKSDDGKDATNFIAVDKGNVRLLPLPAQVLRKVDGYLGRSIDTKFIVYRPGTVRVNGRMVEDHGPVIRVSDDPVKAREYADKHGLEVRLSKENVNTGATNSIDEEIKNLGEMGFLSHSYKRADLHDLHTSVQKSLKSPEELLQETMFTISNTVGTNELINYSINKWMRTYGRDLGVDSFPWSGKIASPSTNTKALRSTEEAEIYRDKIALMAGFTDNQINRNLREGVLRFAEDMAKQASKLGGKGKVAGIYQLISRASAAAARDWVSDIKRINFIRHIALQPIRQALMQSSSGFMYGGVKHASAYYGSGRGVADTGAIAAMKVAGGNPTAVQKEAKLWSKLTGNKPQEIIDIFNDVERSGILEISDHQFLESMNRSAFTFRKHAGSTSEDEPFKNSFGLGLTQTAKRTVDLSANVGFEKGEQFNRLAAFLVTRNKQVVDGEYTGDFHKLGEDASILAQNMGQVNKASFQSGNWSLLFQFQSHTIKMMQYMVADIPGIDSATKRRMLAWNTLAFGTKGVGAGTLTSVAYEKFLGDEAENAGLVEDPVAKKILTDGLYSLGYNALVEAVTGTESNTTLSSTLSPFGSVFADFGFIGVPLDQGGRITNPVTMAVKLGHDVLTGAEADWRSYIGVTGNLIDTGINGLNNMMRIAKADGFTLDEKGYAALVEAAKLLPALNNVAQSRIIHATGAHADRYGNPVVRASLADAVTKAIIGTSNDDYGDYYKLRSEWGSSSKFTQGSDREFQQTGRDMADQLIFMVRALNSGALPREEMWSRAEALTSAIKLGYADHDLAFDVIWGAANKRLESVSNRDGTTALDDYIQAMMSDEELIIEKGLTTVKKKLKDFNTPYADFLHDEAVKIETNSGF